MKKFILLLAVLFLTGCATMSYTDPKGVTVTYTRILTGSDSIVSSVPGAKISVRGQQGFDPQFLAALLQALQAVQ